MVIAVVTVWMVQASVNEIVDVVAVGHGFVATPRSMHVPRFLAAARMQRRAAIGVLVGNLNHMLDDRSVFAGVVQVTIMKIVDMVAVLNTGVLTIGTVLVIVVLVNVTHSVSQITGKSPSRA